MDVMDDAPPTPAEVEAVLYGDDDDAAEVFGRAHLGVRQGDKMRALLLAHNAEIVRLDAAGGQSERMGGLDARRFPVLRPPKGCTTWVPWSAMDEQWAQRIHGQTLERLAQRGGLGPDEIYINRHRLKYFEKVRDSDAVALCNELASNAG